MKRNNCILKVTLAKLCQEILKNWLNLLPVDLTCVRVALISNLGLRPFELLLRMPNGLSTYPDVKTELAVKHKIPLGQVTALN